ncbi:MAG: TonB-dependent receptor [Bacteroidia bacterium]|nr:TonB-dependent receptor [Bacteroidia bacterium]
MLLLRKNEVIGCIFTLLLLLFAIELKSENLPDSIANKQITLQNKRAHLSAILKDINKQTGIVFSYKQSTISKMHKLDLKSNNMALGQFCKDFLYPNDISCLFIPPNTIVLTHIEIHSKNNFTISGFISDSLSGERLIGCNIVNTIENIGTVSNHEGFYSIQTFKDSIELRISYVGYQPKSITVKSKQKLRFDIKLAPTINLPIIIVNNNENTNSVTQESGNNITLKGRQISDLSPLFGESDVFRTLQLLPGIQSVGEGTSGIFVRGGNADQNLVLLDGIQIYNPVHIFGFYSIFNPGIIKNVSMNKGVLPAKYSGRLSSVVDVITKDGNRQHFKGEAVLGLIGSRLTLEGPIGKSKRTTFIASARRSHIDLLLSPFVKKDLSTQSAGFLSAYYFYDLNGKLVHRINKNSKITISFYNGIDKILLNNSFKLDNPTLKIKERDKQSFSWGNTVASIKYSLILSSKSILKVTGWYSSYNFGNQSTYSFEETNKDTSLVNYFDYKFESIIRDFGANADIDYFIMNKWKINVGAQYISHYFQPGVTTLTSNLPNLEPSKSMIEGSIGFEPSIYIDNQIKIGNRSEFNVGLNYAGFFFKSTQYSSLQPRVSFNTYLTKKIVVNIGYSKTQQYMHLLTNSTIGIPSDLWILSSDKIKPQSNEQIGLGFKYNSETFNFGIDGFSKQMHNVIDYKDGANYLRNSNNWADFITAGKGNAIGVEVYVEKTVGKLVGWIGYCLSKSTREFADINNGEPFLFRYNRLHDISSTVTYKINQRNIFSANFIFATGNPITLPNQIYSGISTGTPSVDIYVNNKRNNYIMPNYHRLDINYSNYKKNKLGLRTWSFGFYNVYNRQNAFFITPSYNDVGNRVLRQVTLFPIIPSFTYRQEF